MHVRLIEVPYDSGHWGARMGLGPGALLAAGAAERLRAAGHAVETEIVGSPTRFPTEVATAFEVNRVLAERVRAAAWHSRLPVVLAGNCMSALGVLAGLGSSEPGVVWLDAHADFHSPETTRSGFLDGMALATVAGRCWGALAAGIVGFEPVPAGRILLLGARDLDAGEPEALAEAGVRWLRPERLEDDLPPLLAELAGRSRGAYLHLDLDVLDPREGRANRYAAPGGLGLEVAMEVIRRIGREVGLRAATLSAYDPAQDPDGRAREAGLRLLAAVVDAAAAGPTGAAP